VSPVDGKVYLEVSSAERGLEAERLFGRAARFVKRAVNERLGSFSFYSKTPAQAMYRMLDYMARVKAMRPPFLTEDQQSAAVEAIWEQYLVISKMDVMEHERGAVRRDISPEHPVGDGMAVAIVASAVNQEGCYRAAPSGDPDSGYRHATMAGDMPIDDRYGMRDPVLELSRYKINPRVVLLTPEEDARFELHAQRHIMESLRAVERKLWPRGASRTARETITLRSASCSDPG